MESQPIRHPTSYQSSATVPKSSKKTVKISSTCAKEVTPAAGPVQGTSTSSKEDLGWRMQSQHGNRGPKSGGSSKIQSQSQRHGQCSKSRDSKRTNAPGMSGLEDIRVEVHLPEGGPMNRGTKQIFRWKLRMRKRRRNNGGKSLRDPAR